MSRLTLRDGLELRFEERGRGPLRLLLHGFTGSSEAWSEPLLDRLSADGRVIAVDLLGHGRSDRPEDPERYGVGEQVTDLCEVVTACGAERALWIGYSMGGRIALAAAALRPERVLGLVLEGASPGLATAEERRARREADERLALDLERDGIEPFVERWMSLPLFASQRLLPAELLSLERKRRSQNDARALARNLRGCGTGAQPSFWEALATLSCPVLLLAGEHDVKFRGLADAMAARIPNAERADVLGAGHATHLEQPEIYCERVRAFAQRLQGDPTP